MKITKRIKLFLLFLLILISTSCNGSSRDSIFMKNVVADNINDKIKISQPPTLHYDTVSQCVDLLVINNSSDSIRFPIDYGIHLYIYSIEKKDWTEIRNRQQYSVSIEGMDPDTAKKYIEDQGGLIINPKEDINNNGLISYCPDLSGYRLPVTVRSLIVGTVFQDHKPTDTKVAAYYDLKIDK